MIHSYFKNKLLTHQTFLNGLCFLFPFACVILSLLYFSQDAQIYTFFTQFRPKHPYLTIFFQLVTDYGNSLFYLVYAYILIIGIKNKDKTRLYLVGFYIFFQLSISFLGVRILKIIFGRQRPGHGFAFTFFSFSSQNNSFPSGHTAEVFGASLPLALATKKTWLSFVLGIWAGLVAFSRIYLGKHHPTDVLAGWLIGLGTGYLIFFFWRKSMLKVNKINLSSRSNFFDFWAKRPMLTLSCVYLLHVIFSLHTRELWFSDEVRYADVFTNLLERKKWLVLYLNGQPYPDKPPLYFWFLAGLKWLTSLPTSTVLFLGSAISGFIYLGSSYWLGLTTLKNKNYAFLGCTLLLTNFYFLALIHYVRMDLLFASFIILAHVFFYRFSQSEQKLAGYLGFFFCFLALLTKGPFGVALPLLSLFCFALIQRKKELILNKTIGLGLLGLLGGILIWLGAIWQVKGSSFLSNLLFKQVYARAVHSWHHKQPFYHYLLVFPLVVLPWTILFFNFNRQEWKKLSSGENFLLTSFLTGFGLLSLVSIKIAIYLLPLFAPCFLLLTKNLYPERINLAKWLGGFFLLLAIILPWLSFLPHLPLKFIHLFSLSLIFGLIALILFKSSLPNYHVPILLLWLLIFPFIYIARNIAPNLDALMSPKQQALIIKSYIQQGYTPIAYKIYSGIYTYYAKHKIKEVNDFNRLKQIIATNPKSLLIIPEKRLKKHSEFLKGFKIVNQQRIVEQNYLVLIPKNKEKGND